MAATLKAQKKLLRKAISARLLTVSDVAEQSVSVASRVLALPALQAAKSVSCYLSMPAGEIDTSPIVSQILKLGPWRLIVDLVLYLSEKSLFVPKIEARTSMEFYKIFDIHDLSSLSSGVWGIKEPEREFAGNTRPTAMDEALDLILLPGVAFDRSLSRLGHGKGYYDSYIAKHVSSGKPRPLLVGLALREQLLDATEIPMTEHDWPMDIVVTADEVIDKNECV